MTPMTSETNVSELGLSTRAWGVLHWNNIETMKDLTQLTQSDLKRFRNCGKATITEIQAALAFQGFSLLQPADPKTIAKLRNQIDQLERDLRLANARADYLQSQLDSMTNARNHWMHQSTTTP